MWIAMLGAWRNSFNPSILRIVPESALELTIPEQALYSN
jgi:hypothetical protein